MNRLLMGTLVALILMAPPVHAREIIDSREFDVAWEAMLRQETRYREVTMNISAYTAHEGGNVGAWGKELTVGDCASDDLPQGTKVMVNGKTYIVNDRFGGEYTGRLDLYMGWDLDAAYSFGRQWITVRVEE